jgi:hypothetical protein
MNDHPTDNDLIAYAFGDPDQRNRPDLATHLASCQDCSATLARFFLVQSTVRADATLVPSATAVARVKALIADRRQAAIEPVSIFATLRRVVAMLTFDGRSEVALAGLRGASEAYMMRYTYGELDVDLEIAPSGDDETGPWLITGQVSTAESSGPIELAFAEPGGIQPVVELLSDEDGMFFANLSRGRYDLLIRMAENVIVAPDLEVG